MKISSNKVLLYDLKRLKLPMHLNIDPSGVCNQRCNFCVAEGTMISTPDGSVPIESLKEGDVVLTIDGSFKPITHIFKREYYGDMISLKPRMLPEILVTPEHPIITENGVVVAKDIEPYSRCSRKKVNLLIPRMPIYGAGARFFLYATEFFEKDIRRFKSKIRFNDLGKVIDTIERGYFRIKCSKYPAKQKIPLTYDFGRLCGLYCSEGHVHKYKNRPNARNVCFSFGKHEKELIKFTKFQLEKLTINQTATISKGDTAISVVLSNTIISTIFEELFGSSSHIKKLPLRFLITCNDEFKKGILKGLFEGDSHIGDYIVNWGSVSKSLAYNLVQLLHSKGFFPSFYPNYIKNAEIDGRSLPSTVCWVVSIIKTQTSAFKKYIQKGSKRVWNYYPINLTKRYFKTFLHKKASIPYSGHVYNLEVADNHTYVGGFVAQHNCFFKGNLDPNTGVFRDKVRKYSIKTEKLLAALEPWALYNQRYSAAAITFVGGGEPLLHPDIDYIFFKALEFKISCGLISNFSIELDNKLLALLPKFKWIKVSLDAANKETYNNIHNPFNKDAFDTVINNIKTLDKKVGLSFLVYKENMNEILPFMDLAENLGVSYVQFKPVYTEQHGDVFSGLDKVNIFNDIELVRQAHPDINVIETFSPYLEILDKDDYPHVPCQIWKYRLQIGSDGNVYPCCLLKYSKKYSYGSIYKKDLTEIVNSKIFKAINESLFIDRCPTCWDKDTQITLHELNQLEDVEFV